LLLVGVSASPVSAQLQTTRNLAFIPGADSGAGARFLRRGEFAAEFQRGFGSAGGDLAWDFKLAGMVEVLRWGPSAALTLLLGHEMVATPHNALLFDPRGAVWEEALAVNGRFGRLGWMFGAFNRCRHEIDNGRRADGPGSGDTTSTSRVVILGGWQLGLSWPEITVARRGRARLAVQVEQYARGEDTRTPHNVAPPRWSRARGAAVISGRARWAVGSSTSLYALGWVSAALFEASGAASETGVQDSRRLELGVQAAGGRYGAQGFVAHEHFLDDLVRPVPRGSDVWFVGVRLASSGVQ
jgi:hypothetical protein